MLDRRGSLLRRTPRELLGALLLVPALSWPLVGQALPSCNDVATWTEDSADRESTAEILRRCIALPCFSSLPDPVRASVEYPHRIRVQAEYKAHGPGATCQNDP